jgi:hypothetical protein
MGIKRNYGGRYAIPEEYKRDVFLKVRLTHSEKKSIEELHQKSFYENFSDLVRDVLLKKTIKVKLANIEISSLEKQLHEIYGRCEKFLRTKRESNMELKPQINDMILELQSIKLKLKEINLCLNDITVIEEGEKIKKKQKRYYW